MRPRQINFLRHMLSARQALGVALSCWSENNRLPIILIAPPGEALRIALTIRVALARERSRHPKNNRLSYGFILSDPFPYTDAGVKGEAILLRLRVTPMQQMKNIMLETRSILMEHSNEF